MTMTATSKHTIKHEDVAEILARRFAHPTTTSTSVYMSYSAKRKTNWIPQFVFNWIWLHTKITDVELFLDESRP